MFFLLVAFGCAAVDPCVRPLDEWCWGEFDSGPECGGITADQVSLDFRCGDLDVSSSGPDFTGTTLYFDHGTGQLVASAAWSDVATDCGDWTYWSGRRVNDCEPECTYSGDPDLPACE